MSTSGRPIKVGVEKDLLTDGLEAELQPDEYMGWARKNAKFVFVDSGTSSGRNYVGVLEPGSAYEIYGGGNEFAARKRD